MGAVETPSKSLQLAAPLMPPFLPLPLPLPLLPLRWKMWLLNFFHPSLTDFADSLKVKIKVRLTGCPFCNF